MPEQDDGAMPDDQGRSVTEQRASVQVSEDMRFQERTWAMQRVGWWAMGLLLVAALAGLFATGPLSWAETRDASGSLRVEYARFQRHMAPFTLRLHLAPEAVPGNTVSVHVNNALADAIEVQKIVPQPQQTKVTPTGVEYTFATAEAAKPASIRFFLNSDEVGLLRAEIGLSGRAPARFSVFVYP
jgi:hypothetical protein